MAWGWLRTAAVPAALLAVPVVVVCGAMWPGHMNLDTLAQIDMIRRHFLTNVYAPDLQWLWSLVWPLGVGPGWIFAVQTIVFIAGLYLVLRASFDRIAAAIAADLIAICPPVLGALGLLGRDVWFIALLLLTFGLAIGAVRHPAGREKWWLSGAVVAAWLTLAARQNAVTVLPLPLGFVLWLALGPRIALDRRRAIAAVAGGVVLTAVLMGSQLALNRAIGVADGHPAQYPYEYDLEMLSLREGRNLFPPDVMAQRGMAPIIADYDPDQTFTLIRSSLRSQWLVGAPVTSLASAWRKAVLSRPDLYLRERGVLALRQVSLTRGDTFVYHPGIDPNPWGYHATFLELDRAARAYLDLFTSGPRREGSVIHRIWIYLLLAAASVALMLRRRRTNLSIVVILLAASSWALQVGLFFGAPGSAWRYEEPVVVIGLAATAVAVRGPTEPRSTAKARGPGLTH